MNSDKISVIVPAYNTGAWLPRCLDSLWNQTYENLEIIVVNDGSTDDTKEVLDAWARGRNRVKVIHKENGGVTSARLRGVAEAEGDWIGFADGDDVVEPDMFRHLHENARGADISHCGHQVIFPDGRVEYVHNTGVKQEQDHLTALRELLDGGQVESSLCTKLFRRELFEGLTEWMEPAIRNNEDLLMNYYLFARAKSAVYEDVCPYHYILRAGSASYNQLHEHSLFDPIRVRQKILDACEPELKEEARAALMRNGLFAYGQLALKPERQYDIFRSRVRRLISEQREFYPLLSRRNRILAEMIRVAPWSFCMAYRLYVRCFQREEQH